MRKWLLTIAASLGLLGGTTFATQYDMGTIIPETTTGTQLASHLNQWKVAVQSQHAGSSRPSYAHGGMFWIDTSTDPWLLKNYGGSADTTLGPIQDGVLAGRLQTGSARPTYAGAGTLWVNTSTGSPVLNYYNGTADISMGPIAAEGLGVAPGVEAPFAGPFAPSGWLMEYGQEVSRTTYAALLNAIAPSFSCTTTNGAVGVTTGTNFVGTGIAGSIAKIEGPGIPAGTTVASIYDATGLGMSAAAGVSAGVGTCRIFPHGNGNASSTFNVPDRRGRVIAGRDTMGNTNAGRLEVYFGDWLGSAGGNEVTTLTTSQMPWHWHGNVSVSGSTGGWQGTAPTESYVNSVNDASRREGSSSTLTYVTAVSTATRNVPNYDHSHAWSGSGAVPGEGGGAGFSNMPPTGVSNYIIKY